MLFRSLRGYRTDPAKIVRCLTSLKAQSQQNFGILIAEELIDSSRTSLIVQHSGELLPRITILPSTSHRGTALNTWWAIQGWINNPETLIVILDLDDALMDRQLASWLHEARSNGHDLILGAQFRPDKPWKLYHPEYSFARAQAGGEVWIHLRSFTKQLFSQLSQEDLTIDGQWIEVCEDHAIMIPLSEMAQKPIYIPRYCYFYDRSAPYDEAVRKKRQATIQSLLAKPPKRKDSIATY